MAGVQIQKGLNGRSEMSYSATKDVVFNRGAPPDSFLDQLIAWAKSAPDEIFARNSNPADIYGYTINKVLPGTDRKSALLEVMRVHAGFESSWNWNEGVDTTNRTSMTHLEGQETGIFQVSYDSTYTAHGVMQGFADAHGIGAPQAFIDNMKFNHFLALEYYARLMRVNVSWAGPVLRHQIDAWLRKPAVEEFQSLLQTA